ncbi:hypothetical protein [Flavivirga algicola]|uniref:Anti-sigma factor n=1 Tax=Flavivirga algicola TaxID=2729136 RepID=A0ABX1RUH4_9FLAO|nr:hypothetical protein [Flavivirga algicola]NMH87191.1 hypothetical protein [Flavivirga algicola]
MEPIKFEENIKNKLDKRTLQPSNDAWGKLSERLDSQGAKRKNRSLLWVGLAASIVGVLLVISQFFNNETGVNDMPKIVVVPEVIEQHTDKTIAVEAHVNIETVSQDINKNRKEDINEIIKKPVLITSEFNDEQAIITQENNMEKLKKESVDTSVKVPVESLTFEQKKIQAVANQIQALKDNNTVTDDAIDVLLLEAQKEIQLNQLYNETTGVVDANLLLQDVEAELDQSFRTKVFEAIKASYGTVKTAVAQRND